MSHNTTKTYTLDSKIIEKFESIVPSGQKSKVIQNLISEFNSKSTLKKKNSERKRLSQNNDRRTMPVKQGAS